MNGELKEKLAQFYSMQLEEHCQRFLSWYRGQEARQQMLWLLTGIFLVCMLLVFGIWQPVQARLTKAERYYREQQALYVWISENSADIKTAAPAASPSGQAVTSDIYKSAEKFTLKISQLTTDKQNTMRLQLDNVHFAPLVQWLNDLEKEYSIHVQSAIITQEGTSQNINATIDMLF